MILPGEGARGKKEKSVKNWGGGGERKGNN